MENLILIFIGIVSLSLGFLVRPYILSIVEEKALKSFFDIRESKFILNFIYSLVFFGVSILFSSKILFYNDISLFLKLLVILIALIVVWGLLFLAIFDILYFEVPDIVSLILLVILFVSNILILFLTNFSGTLKLWEGNFYDPLQNIWAGTIGALFILFIVFVTKGKGMGSGDIRIAGIMGLILGLSKLLAGFYLTIFSASIIGILLSIKIRKFKGVQIPFVPFIVFGTLVAFLFGNEISQFISSIYNLY